MMTHRGRKLALVAVGLVAALAIFGWRFFRASDLVQIGTGYTAEQTCACMLVVGRSLESCLTDLDPLARKLITIHPGKDEVTATAFGIVSATAQYEKGFGCSLRD
jgi:hypothetical protein